MSLLYLIGMLEKLLINSYIGLTLLFIIGWKPNGQTFYVDYKVREFSKLWVQYFIAKCICMYTNKLTNKVCEYHR